MGVALLVMSGLEAVTGTGFETALLQRQGDIEEFYDSAFTVQVLRGLALAVLLWLVAPLAAAFVHAPAVVPVLRAIAFVVVLRGCSNPARVRVFRDLRYDKFFWWSLPEVVVVLSLSIILGIALRNVWALVIPTIAGQAVATAVSYVLARRAPRFAFVPARVKELVAYSKWVLGTQVMTFLSLQGDNAFVARFLGVGALGFYQVAFRIAELPVTGFTHVVTQVGLPTLSALQSDRARLRSSYAAAQGMVVAVHGAFVAVILLFGGLLVHTALGTRWMPIVPALKVLAVAMLIRSVVEVASTLFNAMGVPRFSYRLHTLRVLAMAVALYPLSQWLEGITGVAVAVLLSLAAALILCEKQLRGTLGGNVVTDLRDLLKKRLGKGT